MKQKSHTACAAARPADLKAPTGGLRALVGQHTQASARGAGSLERCAGETTHGPASRKRGGQALVELALVATLIFFLFSAAIDVGLLYLSYQALSNAAEEGVMFGSMMPVDNRIGGTGVTPNDEQIILRIRNESFSPNLTNRVGVVNMLDLNSDGVDDVNQAGVLDEYIEISAVRNALAPAQESCASRRAGMCEIRVRLSFDYNTFFFLAPAIGAGTVQIAVERSATIHHLNVK